MHMSACSRISFDFRDLFLVFVCPCLLPSLHSFSLPAPKTSGEGAGNLNDPNKEALAKTEVSLTLTNKFDVPGDENAEMDARTILLK